MPNVYDQAHKLARALRDSEEYRAYRATQEKVKDDESNRNLIKQYREKQMELHAKQLQGETLTDDDHQAINRLREILELKSDVREFLQAEARLFQMMSDIQGILSDAVDLDFE